VAVTKCIHCQAYVQWFHTKFGTRLPFNDSPVAVDSVDPGQAWVTGSQDYRGRKRTVLMPISHMSQFRREAVRHVVTIHRCAQYEAAAELLAAER
jgi:hypothetical protein